MGRICVGFRFGVRAAIEAAMHNRLPFARPGMVIGLFGGSFDPAHAGHVHVSREAMKRLRLDALWWLVSPGNPLKDKGPAPMAARMAAARALVRHPRIRVTGIEEVLGTRYTAGTVGALRRRYPGVRFVWIMGADNLAQFHRWQRWRSIMASVPIAVVARPGERISARTSMASRVYREAKLPMAAAPILGRTPPPAWVFLNLPMREESSSAIRAAGQWPPQK